MSAKTFLGIFSSIEIVVNSLVRTIVNIFTFAITEIAPMVAPLPPAFSIYRAMTERLHVPIYVAIVAAIAIEIIGMFSSKVSIRCYQWNTRRNKTDQSVPQAISITMTSIFFTVVFLLALTVDLFPALTALVIPGFVLIAISVYVNLAIHTNLEKLETDKTASLELKDERNGLVAQIRQTKKDLTKLQNETQNLTAKRAALFAEIAAQKAANSGDAAQNTAFVPGDLAALDAARNSKKAKIAARRQEVLRLYRAGETTPKIAEITGYSPDTIRRDIKSMNGKVKA
jgi:DNA-binding CsgD family transcriptional regulator